MTTGPVNGAGKPRVLHEYSFEVMSVDALPQGEIKTITPYWSNVLQELHRLPADKAIFFRHYSERPLTTEISKMRANFATQLRRYMPKAKLVVTRDVVRGGIFIHHAKEEAAPAADPDVDPDPVCSCSPEWRQLWEKGLRGPTNWTDRGGWHIVACALCASDGLQGLQQPDVENDDNAGMVGASGEAGFNADSKTTQSPDPTDEDVGAYVEPLTPEEQEDDDLGAFPFQGETQAQDQQKPKAKAKATRGEDPKPDPFGCGCPSWWRATPAFRKYAPDKSGPYHHDACPRRCSWEEIDHVGACSCTPTPGDIAAQASKSTAVEHTADAWFEPGDWHGKRCARHVHRFRLPPAGSGSLAGVQVGVCICGELKGHSNERAGAGAGKPTEAANVAES